MSASAPPPPPGQYDFTPTPPAHPSSTSSMALGLIGLIGILLCGGITLMLSPFAWALGSRALREIDADPMSYSGREQAQAGRVMGIIGTALLVLAIVVLVVFVVFFAWAVTTNDFEFGEA